MRSRSLYHFILRLHPACFRKQYEDQMMWIFDESVASRSAVPLLFDGFVSLLRQWVLRSGYWRHSRPAAIDGAMVLAEALHRNSEKHFRKAWQLNILWMSGALAVLWMCPVSTILKFQFIGLAANAITLFSGKKSVRGGPLRLHYISLFYYKNSREFYRAEAEARRDGLRAWIAKAGGFGSARSIGILLLIILLLWLIRPVIRYYLGFPNPSLDWDHSRFFVYGLIVWALSFRYLAKANNRAAQAIQEEIDAMDETSTPQSA